MKPALALVAAMLLLSGCMRNPTSQEAAKEYTLRGEIKALNDKDRTATIAHERIEGWMEAMTMEFPVKDQADFERLAIGQRIEAKVTSQNLEFWISDVKPAAPTEPDATVPNKR